MYETGGAYNDRFEAWLEESLPRYFAAATGFSYLGTEIGRQVVDPVLEGAMPALYQPMGPEGKATLALALGTIFTYQHAKKRNQADPVDDGEQEQMTLDDVREELEEDTAVDQRGTMDGGSITVEGDIGAMLEEDDQ